MEYKSNKKKKWSLSTKEKIAKAAIANQKKIKANPAAKRWCDKKRKWVRPSTQIGYKAMTVRELFVDMAEEHSNTQAFKNACKLVCRSVNLLKAGAFQKEGNTGNNRFRVEGGGARQRAPEVRYALFEYYVDVRDSLKGRLPKKIFLAKARSLYKKWKEDRTKDGEEVGAPLSFTRNWLKGWCQEYQVSCKHPNKRFSISAVDRKERIIR